jgi:hypothetical protein
MAGDPFLCETDDSGEHCRSSGAGRARTAVPKTCATCLKEAQ